MRFEPFNGSRQLKVLTNRWPFLNQYFQLVCTIPYPCVNSIYIVNGVRDEEYEMPVIDKTSWNRHCMKKRNQWIGCQRHSICTNVRQLVGGHLTSQVAFAIIYIIRSMTAHSMRSECYKAPPSDLYTVSRTPHWFSTARTSCITARLTLQAARLTARPTRRQCNMHGTERPMRRCVTLITV
jgi:hypothetical protein